jgi:hypothetical protein
MKGLGNNGLFGDSKHFLFFSIDMNLLEKSQTQSGKLGIKSKKP